MKIFNKYAKGSTWRKWDLQVQPTKNEWLSRTGDSAILDKIQGRAKEFVAKGITKNLSVIGITDHNSGVAIDYILNVDSRLTVLPGVELDMKEGWHVLLIFNPKYKDFLRKETWKETIETFLTHTCKITPPFYDENNNSKKVDITSKDFIEEVNIKNIGIPVFAHCCSGDGFFQRGDNQSRKEILNLFDKGEGQFIFEIKGEFGQIDEIRKKIKNICNKEINIPIISSSDSHEVNEIGGYSTWIKADPTYEGLKQILYEPDRRIYIGEEPLEKSDYNRIIKELRIKKSNGWFDEELNYEFSEDQISIIGGKGTGKTALLDFIAYATGSFDLDKKSFLIRANKELVGCEIEIIWKDNSSSKKIITAKLEEPLPLDKRKVYYLSQSFVEKLCSYDQMDILTEQIDNVIFQNIAKGKKLQYLNFKDYKDAQLKIIKSQQARMSKQIEASNTKIFEIKSKVSRKSELDKLKNDSVTEVKKHKKEYDKLKSSQVGQQKKDFETFEKLSRKKSNAEEEVSKINDLLLLKNEIAERIDEFLDEKNIFIEDIREKLLKLGITNSEVIKFNIQLVPKNLHQIIDKKEASLNVTVNKLNTKLTKVGKSMDSISNVLKLEESRKKRLQELSEKIAENNKKIDLVKKDLIEIKKLITTLPHLEKEREETFLNFFTLLYQEFIKLKEIYSPIAEKIKLDIQDDTKLFEFSVKYFFNLSLMAERCSNLIDHNKSGRYYQSKKNAIEEDLRKIFFDLTFSYSDKHSLEENKNLYIETNKDLIIDFIASVFSLFASDKAGHSMNVSDQLKKSVLEKDFYSWLYSTDYYKMNYSIRFNDIDLDKLSPGLKGLALLVLYLELDEQDNRPLLIDQPEENLDNRSVYETLRKYFLKAKKRRQIFLVTHNPNLVVNTDSEQIIVSNFNIDRLNQHSNIYHVSGSLEHILEINENLDIYLHRKGIRQHICHILEGGEVAFKKRERRYDISSELTLNNEK